jgi:alkylhydroperoxidase/carboxymuconolactone decarboxylase family protein YurZ
VLQNLNLLLLVHFRGDLAGASGAPLREAVSLAVAPSKYPEIKTHLGIALRQP